MTRDNLLILVSLAFVLFTVIFTVGTASFVCFETNDKKKENNDE
jgi:hypothetical protein